MTRAILLACLLTTTAALAAEPQPQPQTVRAQVAMGKEVFETTCGSGNCHGTAGAGGQGPSLNRPLAPALVQSTIQNGRPNTVMPAFKDIFDGESLSAVVAYVISISSGGKAPTSVLTVASAAPAGAARQAPASPWLAANTSATPVAIGKETGHPQAGVTLFFDAANLQSCRGCHTYRGAGGPVGPDLAKMNKSAAEVLRSLTTANVASANYPGIALTLKDGSKVAGVKRDENAQGVRYYDVSSVPPVSRRVRKADITAQTEIKDAGVYDHTKLPYARQDLLDVSAFLGKTAQ